MQYFGLKFQRIWNIIKFYTIYFRKKNFFRKISSALVPKNVRFFIVSIVRKPRVSTENNSHMFSLRNMFSRRTKRRILVSLACLVRRYSCYATERLVMSFRLAFPQLCLSLEERKKKKRKRKERPAWKGTWTSRFIHVLPVSTRKRDLSKWRERFLF